MRQAQFPGGKLRELREQRGLERQDVFQQIHVPVQYIAALESGQLEDLPVPAYAAGFLASYCEFLELDAEPFVSQFRACTCSGKARTVEPRAAWRAPFSGTERPAWSANLVTWSAICAVLLLGWLTYMAIVQPFVEERGIRVEADTPEPPRLEFFDENF